MFRATRRAVAYNIVSLTDQYEGEHNATSSIHLHVGVGVGPPSRVARSTPSAKREATVGVLPPQRNQGELNLFFTF